MSSPTTIAAYVALFALTGFLFLFANLVIGRLVRPRLPNTEKYEVYECGEPTIGSSFVQFDLRFYVVALLFIIFDVEIAFFFPWANVFGKATNLKAESLEVVREVKSAGGPEAVLTPAAAGLFREMGVPASAAPSTTEEIRSSATTLAKLAIIDIIVFF